MKALLYSTKVQIDPVHSWGDRFIAEIFIPSIKCCFNEEGFAFSSKAPRNNGFGTIEIEMSKKEVQIIKHFVETQTKMRQICKNHFK